MQLPKKKEKGVGCFLEYCISEKRTRRGNREVHILFVVLQSSSHHLVHMQGWHAGSLVGKEQNKQRLVARTINARNFCRTTFLLHHIAKEKSGLVDGSTDPTLQV